MPCCRWDLPMSPVRYPELRKRRTKVLAFQSSERSLKTTPWALGILPVIMLERLGMQTGLETQVFSNTMPALANPSRLGVCTIEFPINPT